MDMMLLDRAALLLWPDAPSARLASIAGRPKSTARSWRSARRRAPARVLSLVRTELQSRSAEILRFSVSSMLRLPDAKASRRPDVDFSLWAQPEQAKPLRARAGGNQSVSAAAR